MPVNYSLDIVPASQNIDYYLGLLPLQTGETAVQSIDPRLKYNPVTGILTVPNIKLRNKNFNQDNRSTITFITAPTTQSLAAGYHQNISGMEATITPTSVNSKILITVKWHGEFSSDAEVYNTIWGLRRNGQQIGMPLSSGARRSGITVAVVSYFAADNTSTAEALYFSYLDSPATTLGVTYQLTCLPRTAITLYQNRTVADIDNASYERGVSSITLVEVG
jgi:hypothetical protein